MVSATTGYVFFIDADADFYYCKTTDGGATWGSPVSVFTGTAFIFGCWYDRWTPGDTTGNLIYTWYGETGTDDIKFRTLDTSSDTLGTEQTVFNGATLSAASNKNFVSGAKMRGGNLYVAFNGDDITESGLYRSTDGGSSWTSRTNPMEADLDVAFVFPGNEADNQDCWIIYLDASTDELTLKVHDDSGNSNSESSPITHADLGNDLTGHYGFSGAIRHSDGHLILAHFTEYDTLTADLEVYDINGTGSITQKTNVVTNADDCYYPSVFVAANNHIYVAYLGKDDGTESLGSSLGLYYKVSTDGGATWGSEVAYSQTSGNYRSTYAPLNGSLFLVVWRNHTSGAQITNAVNAVAPPPPSAGQMMVILCG